MNHRSTLLSGLVILAVATLCTACGEATSPEVASRRYVLTSVDGQPLPAPMFATVLDSVIIEAATAEFRSDSQLERRWTVRSRRGGLSSITTTDTRMLSVQRVGAGITLEDPCTPLPHCPDPSTAVVTDSVLTLHLGVIGGARVLRFVRSWRID